jgi:excisionase family DNA binding protein
MPLDREARCGGLKPITVTVKQALAISGLGLTKLYELINDGTLKAVHVGSRRLIKYDSIEKLLSGEAPEPPVKRRPGRPRKAEATLKAKVKS